MNKSSKVSCLALFVVILIMASVLVGCSSENSSKELYKSGVAAYEAGDMELARSYLSKCSDYKDAEIYLEAINNKNRSDETTSPSSTTITESFSPTEYYDRGTAAYENEDYEGALDFFKAANGYKDANDYIALCEDAILLSNVLKWADSLSDNLLPRISEVDGKEQVIYYRSNIGKIQAGDGKDYEVVYFLDLNSQQAVYTIRYLQYLYPDRTREEIVELLKDPALD